MKNWAQNNSKNKFVDSYGACLDPTAYRIVHIIKDMSSEASASANIPQQLIIPRTTQFPSPLAK